jgi:hypothetical protein
MARTQEIGIEFEGVSLIALGIHSCYATDNPSEDKIKFLPTDSFSLIFVWVNVFTNSN